MSEPTSDDAMRNLLEQELIEASKAEAKPPERSGGAAASFRQSIADIAAEVLKIPRDRLDVRENMSRYGVDSIIVTEIMRRISDLLDLPIAPTVFFEARHLEELADVLHQRYGKTVAELPASVPAPVVAAPVAPVVDAETNLWIARFRAIAAGKSPEPVPQAVPKPDYEPVAIIAMDGTFAQSADLEQFEQHLRDGDDCIGEVPLDRWNWRDVFGDPQKGEFTNVKYGGFAPDIDKFDPQFFGMSPREAELTDPQHRLFIQCAWRLVERAGYAPKSLSGSKVGIFLGINLQDYAHLIDRAGAMEALHLTALGHMFCPNRLSFYLDTHGPSQVIDTACSSSLVALHRAVLSVQHEGCEMAIAGGANLMISPDMHIMYSKVGMICEDGRCKTFSRQANGYARGDGVGAVLLKRLSAAERDGDTILAVIRGSAENHGGMSTSLTAPNPKAQAGLIVEAHRKAGTDPRSVGYIECHGTGTALGDPIEVNGLKMAFEELYREAGLEPPRGPHCGLGSVKSNIGHAETAAGIAGVIKTVLALRNARLYPTLHCDELNPMIELDRSPFRVLQQGGEWERPVVDGQTLPRRAGVSSFGAGGSNAHVVIEEYVGKVPTSRGTAKPLLILLSAQNAARLGEVVGDLRRFLDTDGEGLDIADIAYTLQTGRDAMAERLALIVHSTDELRARLAEVSTGADLYRGSVKRGQSSAVAAKPSDDLRRLAELWVGGAEIDWSAMHGEKRRRVALPAYPFAKRRCWLEGAGQGNRRKEAVVETLHPLAQRNTSDLTEQRFTSSFTGREFFLADHVVMGDKVLPGVAYLEMARAAVALSGGTGSRLHNVVWARPYVVGDAPAPLHIGLRTQPDGQIAYRIYSTVGTEQTLHSQGTATSGAAVAERVDIAALRGRMTGSLDAAHCYDSFKAMGIAYGSGHRCLETVHFSSESGARQVLARLVLPAAMERGADAFVLHPGLTDSALQACIGLVAASEGEPKDASLPFALDEVELLSPPPRTAWVWIRYAQGSAPTDRVQKLDIDLCDDEGGVCVRLRGFSSRASERKPSAVMRQYLPAWAAEPVADAANAAAWARRSVVLCDLNGSFPASLEKELPGVSCTRLRLTGVIAEWYGAAVQKLLDMVKDEIAGKGAGRSLIQVAIPGQGEAALLAGLSGLIKTANRESTRVFCQLVEVDRDVAAALTAESRGSIEQHVRYVDGVRQVSRWQEFVGDPELAPWKDEGVYLITGGNGGLGQAFAQHIARVASSARVILCGRSGSGLSGSRIEYRQADITRPDQVEALVADIRRRFGRLDGVLHAAGLLRDNFIAGKSAAEVAEVLAPKVTGTLNLDAAIGDADLDFLALFSSAAGALGSAGQADYAAANGFLDAFASHRNAEAAAGRRCGRAISIDWTLWAGGGMQMEAAALTMMRQSTGIEPLPLEAGIRAFDRIVAAGTPQALVMHGTSGLKQPPSVSARETPTEAAIAPEAPVPAPANMAGARAKIAQMLARSVASLMKFELGDIDIDTEWNQYGFDSISLTEFSNKLNQQYELELTPTAFFEYQTIGELSAWLAEHSSPALARALGLDERPRAVAPAPAIVERPASTRRFAASAAPVVAAPVPRNDRDDAVAIIGMSGRFPMAADLDEFWGNLLAGRDCIGEIPAERWDWRIHPDDPKWGAFIEGVGNFDSRFFGISPREAALMDPQQRLLMTYAWKAIEDAGYTGTSLAGGNTGMIIGTASSGYGDLMGRSGAGTERYASTGVVGSIGPNRMSYFLNVHGPSEPVETACSSSLVAIHRALSAMASGDCDQAIVGGINLILTPETHISFNRAGMLCPDGRCKTFSARANGYVRGEGVGMLMLKKLRLAEQAGDHIYAVIRGSAENHGGRANSLTAPNPKAQTELLKRAYTRAGIDPRTIGYIEAHGTGTELGDPIEVASLKTAFRDLYKATGSTDVAGAHCGLGSVKSNIGHLELAAGIAGVIKVLLQLKHKTLVRTLHCEDVNPYLRLEGSPFYLLHENRPWAAPRDADGNELPRRAGVSSFGFGGVNAHIVIEEYRSPQPEKVEAVSPGMIVLSARTPDRLKASAANLLAFIGANAVTEAPPVTAGLADRLVVAASAVLGVDRSEIDAARPLEDYGIDALQRSMLQERLGVETGLDIPAAAVRRGETLAAIAADILEQVPVLRDRFAATTGPSKVIGHRLRLEELSYTLQVGREPMVERLAFVADSIEQAERKLRAFVEGRAAELDDVFVGNAKQDASLVAAFGVDEDLQEALEKWIQRGKLAKLLQLWTKGLGLDWSKFYGGDRPRRIPLPGYPFLEQRHWIDALPAAEPAPKAEVARLRPNMSLTGAEFFLTDHRVQGRKILPGAAYLEMMRAAVAEAGTQPSGTMLRLQDIIWIAPAVVDQPRQLKTTLTPDAHGTVRCEVASDQVHSQALASFMPAATVPRLDVAAILARPELKRFEARQGYELFGAAGLDYGPSHRAIGELHAGGGEVLARLVLPSSVADSVGEFGLHPSMVDGAFQASIGLALQAPSGGPTKLALPFAVEAVDVLGACTASMWAWVRRSAGSSVNDRLQRLDIDLCDEQGEVRVRIKGFASRLIDAAKPAAPPKVAAPSKAVPEAGDLRARSIVWFKDLIAETLHYPAEEIRADEAFDSYGLDSMMAMELAALLEKSFGPLSKTLFFEHHTLAELVDFFLEAHRPALLKLLERDLPVAAAVERPAERLMPAPARPISAPAAALDIAIVGLSGRYPQSPDIEAYWRNLRDGRDCITEVPADRWDWRDHYSADRTQPDRHYCKWGGFIADIDKFDPLFFNISPSAAEHMDPQERLFLEHAWMAMEDAGYRREDLQKPRADDDLPGQVGVYAGIMYGEYQLVGLEARLGGESTSLGSFYAGVANRVSHALNLHGPSMAVDTMCSSSLTAIHLACLDLKLGRTDMALAGGVNLTLHPNKYTLLSQGQYISSSGRCESFGAGGDGYVPSEGVGVVLLKRLADAERDGDHIYGVIKGSALNHGGKTNGYSVPNPKAQQTVIGRALRESGVDPRAIGYVEAHGTGTSLGDPIEITGLTRAFGALEHCWIGSAKSNIGHGESAAGIAGLTKVLLQMREGQIAPSLHAATLNPNIDFAKTPFEVNRELRAWPRPTLDGEVRPRAAGLSSFGAGGSNAHLVIEEYVRPPAAPVRSSAPSMVVLSAKSEAQLRQSAEKLLQFVQGAPVPTLRDLAYTLQVGREAMQQRLGFTASSLQELADKLDRFLKSDTAGLHVGRARLGSETRLSATSQRPDELLAGWIAGATVDWQSLHAEDEPPLRVSLPTYPFARERYWGTHIEVPRRAAIVEAAPDMLMLAPAWKEQAIDGPTVEYIAHWVLSSMPLPEISGATVVALPPEFTEAAVQLFERIKAILQGRPRGLVLLQVVVDAQDSFGSALAGLLKTARMENPNLVGQLIELESGRPDLADLLKDNGRRVEDRHVRCLEGRREVRGWVELGGGDATPPVWRQGGTYLITGGAGGLGLHFAREIARQVNDVTLILTGRSPLDAARQAALEEVRALGARAEYRTVDVADPTAVDGLIGSLPGLNGIIHSAGVLRDGFILRKSASEFRDVLAPKVSGAINLDRASRSLGLDFFVLFSSLAGAAGNPGQSDYATANAFLDAFAAWRSRQPDALGQTLSIDWPLWRDGGMGLDARNRELLWQSTGLRPLETETGIAAFHRGLESGRDQVVVVQGDLPRLRGLFLEAPQATAEPTPVPQPPEGGNDDDFAARAQGLIVKMLSEMLKVPPHRLEADVPLEEYGIDSVAMMKLTGDLEKIVGPLPKTLLYEHPTIEAVSAYLAGACAPQLAKLFGAAPEAVARPLAPAEPVKPAMLAAASRDIAVIGMSGRFPMAADVDAFWRNLVEGRDCITEVPAGRWDHSLYFDPDKDRPGKTYCKWGGFLDDVDRFDAPFFRISRTEAELLDPQERLFLETVWNLLESSGHLGETLQRIGPKVGVFVGSMSQQYHAVPADLVRESIVALSSPSSIANRVSYFFDFRGPSIAIDTMCSSALNAVHMACESLLAGDCKLAVAGGVNLTIHPKKYLALSAGQLIGSHPGSTSFGDGDGYLPAEAVGAVLLKPLSDAIADGDEVLAVIKSTAVNHGGQSNGYRVPNSAAQVELIAGNFAKSGIDPRTIGYVESAANGSPLGDAIELNALATAFRRSTPDTQFCAIGSVKSNIGHAEAASGITQLIKTILQLRHARFVPHLKAQPLNPNLVFEPTPFRLQRTLEDWPQPDGHPRRAAVSSFGAGGSNAHLIVEEYDATRRDAVLAEPQLILLSARTPEQLAAAARQLLAFADQAAELRIDDLAYTLQMGREAMDHRLASVAVSRDDLVGKLRAYLANDPSDVFVGDATQDHAEARQLFSGKTGQSMLAMLIAERDLEKLAHYWSKGVRVAWQSLHEGRPRRHIALPTYPFDRQSYWLGDRTREAFAVDEALTTEDNVARYVAHLVGELLGVEAMAADRTLQDYGGDSVAAARLQRGIEKVFQVKVTARDMLSCADLGALIRLVAGRMPQSPQSKKNPEPVGAGQIGALSEGQKGLWLLHQLAPQMSAYNVPIALTLTGGIEIGTFRQACEHMLSRFPLLGTTFGLRDGEPCQTVAAAPRLEFEIVAAEEDDVVEIFRAHSKRPFDLARGPLMRVLVASPHALIVVHHIVFDGSSAVLLAAALEETYRDLVTGRVPALTAVEATYADFVDWQRRFMEGEAGQAQLAYWRRQLAGELSVLSLPYDRPPRGQRQFAGATEEAVVESALSAEVTAFARNLQVNPSVVFLGAFCLLLRRYGGNDDLLVGMPVSGRPESRFDRVVGYFVNMLCIRSRTSPGEDVAAYLKELQAILADGLDNGDYPYPALLRALRIDRDPVQVMFAYQNFLPAADPSSPMQMLPGVNQEGSHELALEVYRAGDTFRLKLDYATELFDAGTIRRALAHYVQLLGTIASGRVPSLLTDDERHRILVEWNRNETEYDTARRVIDLFRQQVARTPDAAALEFEGHSLSYRELNQRSDEQAARLAGRSVVGMRRRQGFDAIVDLLAIWKSGAVYVPVSPAYPEPRLRHMIEDSGMTVLLTDDGVRETGMAAASSMPPDAAYVIYTSGSTGQPKGVAVSHRSIAQHCQVMRDYYGLEARDRVLQFSSLSFDASLDQILPTLICGATVVLRPGETWSAREFKRQLVERGITVIDVMPSYLHELLLDGSPEWGALRLVIVGGEALRPETLRLWRESGLGDRCRLVNAYGPTETTVTSIAADLGKATEVLIGRPLPGESAYILDGSSGEPVPVGVPGELHIGGAGLALGYLNQPELTRRKFVETPAVPGKRLYRTGDRACWREDGSIVFLGRLDDQVKVRGFRVECGEVEAALRAIGSIAQAAVIMRDGKLVAFVEQRPGMTVDYRQALASTLPDYMIPTLIVPLAALPLTSGDKVDRAALRQIDLGAAIDRPLVEPRSELETELVGIWREVLGVERIGVQDDFFALGGHSLLAMRLVALLHRRLGRELPLSSLFEAPDIERQAAMLERGERARSPLVCLQAEGAAFPLFLVHAVDGDVLCYRELARHLGTRRPIHALQAPKVAHPGTVEGLAKLYVEAIRAVQPSGPYHLGGWSMGGVIACEMARQLQAAGERTTSLLLIDSYTPDAVKALGPIVPSSQQPLWLENAQAMDRYEIGLYAGNAALFAAGSPNDAQLGGWSKTIDGNLTVMIVPGDHYSILATPNVRYLAERLGGYLDEQVD